MTRRRRPQSGRFPEERGGRAVWNHEGYRPVIHSKNVTFDFFEISGTSVRKVQGMAHASAADPRRPVPGFAPFRGSVCVGLAPFWPFFRGRNRKKHLIIIDRIQDGPKSAQDAPREPQDRLKIAQDGPKSPQDGPKIGPDGPNMSQDGPKTPPEGPKIASRSPKMAPRAPKTAPRWIQAGPKSAQDVPKSAPRPPKSSLSAPNPPEMPSRAPKIASRPPKMLQEIQKSPQDTVTYRFYGFLCIMHK